MDYGSTWDPREVIMILGNDGVCYPPESGRDATTDGDILGQAYRTDQAHEPVDGCHIGRVAALLTKGLLAIHRNCGRLHSTA